MIELDDIMYIIEQIYEGLGHRCSLKAGCQRASVARLTVTHVKPRRVKYGCQPHLDDLFDHIIETIAIERAEAAHASVD